MASAGDGEESVPKAWKLTASFCHEHRSQGDSQGHNLTKEHATSTHRHEPAPGNRGLARQTRQAQPVQVSLGRQAGQKWTRTLHGRPESSVCSARHTKTMGQVDAAQGSPDAQNAQRVRAKRQVPSTSQTATFPHPTDMGTSGMLGGGANSPTAGCGALAFCFCCCFCGCLCL